MIEAWGRGFDKIKEACVKYDGRLPEYNISASGIMVLCKACDKYLELLNGNENNSLISDERIMSELMNGKMKEPIQWIIDYINKNDTITTSIGIEITGKSEAQVRRYLKVLTEYGVIKSKKTTKGNIYTKL